MFIDIPSDPITIDTSWRNILLLSWINNSTHFQVFPAPSRCLATAVSQVTYHALLNAMVNKGDRTSAWRMVTEMKSRLRRNGNFSHGLLEGLIITGWWFGTSILCSQKYWESHHPNWLSYFSEGFKPPTSYNINNGGYQSGFIWHLY